MDINEIKINAKIIYIIGDDESSNGVAWKNDTKSINLNSLKLNSEITDGKSVSSDAIITVNNCLVIRQDRTQESNDKTTQDITLTMIKQAKYCFIESESAIDE